MSLVYILYNLIKAILLFVLIAFYFTRIYLRSTTGICKSKRDLKGKLAIITGGNTGLGKEVVRDLALRNAKIILACRTVKRGHKAAQEVINSTGNNNIHVRECDLSSIKSVRNFANDILTSETRLDILICFAGTGTPFGKHLTEDGIETQFATNHLGHFLLVNLLIDLLKSSAPSRIVVTSSLAHRFGNIDLENIVSSANYVNHPFTTYGDTKLANVMFMKELSERLEGTGVCVNALHPGTIYTNGVKYNTIWYMKIFLLLLCFLYNRTVKEGAQTILYLAVSEQVEGITGQYFADCRKANYNPQADDKSLCRKLWDISAKLCDIDSDRISQ